MQVNQAAFRLANNYPSRLMSIKLPWREYKTPYRIFLAEFLLVRTRADVVAFVFETIFNRFPNIAVLADAPLSEVEEALKPLGLRKRVPYLVAAANYIMEHYAGHIPSEIDALLKVPGLGLYTATAIAAFAFGHSLVPGDVNIYRFVARLTGLSMEHKTKGSQALRALLPELSKERSTLKTEWLLDFTRLICRPSKPLCSECPLRSTCCFGSTTQP